MAPGNGEARKGGGQEINVRSLSLSRSQHKCYNKRLRTVVNFKMDGKKTKMVEVFVLLN